jgi:hypothetical protein
MQRGQASVEYVVVIAVVAVALAVAGAVVGADAIPRAVAGEIRRAYCIVSHGDCHGEDGPRPCVQRSREDTHEKRGWTLVGRLTDGRSVLVEERSDGTVAVTEGYADDARAGPRVGGVLDLQLGGRLRAGRRWVVPDRAAAERLVARLEHDKADVGGAVRDAAAFLRGDDADERFAEIGSQGAAAVALRELGIDTYAEVIGGLTVGARVHRGTGRRTVLLRVEHDLVARLTAPLARLAGTGASDAEIAATFDRDGEPLELTLRQAGELHSAARSGPYASSGGDRGEVEARLDLTDPRTRALASAFLDKARHLDRDALDAAAALGDHLAQNARIDVRRYATTRDEDQRGGGFFAAGYETVDIVETARLVDAYGRDGAGAWMRRIDCMGVA